MATNEVHYPGNRIEAIESDLVSASGPTNSGDPVRWGQLPGVALKDADTTNDVTPIATEGVYNMSVKGETTVNAAISAGDIIYLDGADGSAILNADSTNGVRWGYALEDVASGATTTIKVKVGY